MADIDLKVKVSLGDCLGGGFINLGTNPDLDSQSDGSYMFSIHDVYDLSKYYLIQTTETGKRDKMISQIRFGRDGVKQRNKFNNNPWSEWNTIGSGSGVTDHTQFSNLNGDKKFMHYDSTKQMPSEIIGFRTAGDYLNDDLFRGVLIETGGIATERDNFIYIQGYQNFKPMQYYVDAEGDVNFRSKSNPAWKKNRGIVADKTISDVNQIKSFVGMDAAGNTYSLTILQLKQLLGL